MGFFKPKQKQAHDNDPLPQSKGTRKKWLWSLSRREGAGIQAELSPSNIKSKNQEEDKQRHTHGESSDGDPAKFIEAPQLPRVDTSEGQGSASLWDRAYDSLKSNNKTLVTEYEELLWKELAPDLNSPDQTSKDPMSNLSNHGNEKPSEIANKIEQNNPQRRRSQMNEMIEAGLLRKEEKKIKYRLGSMDHVLEDDIAAGVNLVLSVKDWIGEATKLSPEASLIWAGVSAVLPFLTNPSTSSKANSDGFSYVTSRLRYYVAFENLLLPINQRAQIPADLRREFEQHIEELYQHILEFQLRSIVRFYKCRFGNLGRDMFQLDDWNQMVSKIKELEDIFDRESNQINTAASLDNLTLIGESTRKMLDRMNEQLSLAKDHRDIASEHLIAIKEQHKEVINLTATKEEEECLQLFRLVDTNETGYEWYKNRVEERVEGTCKWFLNHQNFKNWLKQESELLLVSADPGCGKSVLAKFLIDNEFPRLIDSRSIEPSTICYFFFKDQIQSSIKQALCALLHQLFLQKPLLIRHAMASKRENGAKLIHVLEELWEILKNAIRDDEAGQVICVLDALDECDDTQRKTFTNLLKDYFRVDSSRRGNFKMVITSRPYEQITSGFRDLVELFPHMRIPGEDESHTISEEINSVITHRVRKLEQNKSRKKGSLKHLEKRLLEIKHRTYLWLYLVFDYLENEPAKLTEEGIQDEVIDNVPLNVEDAYEKLLMKSRDKKKAKRIFNILLAAYRPLTLGEMQIAFEIKRTSTSMKGLSREADDHFGQRLREYCGLFVSINGGKIYFLHQTAREFLLSTMESTPAISPSVDISRHSMSIQQAHSLLADCFITFLKFPEWLKEVDDNGSAHSHMGDQNIIEHSFLAYATRYWATHLRQAGDKVDSAILDGSLELCNTRSERFYPWFQVYWKTVHYGEILDLTDLMVGSYFGLEALVRLLLTTGKANVESTDRYGQTPLSRAAMNGHEAVVELLLTTGNANVESTFQYGQTLLSQAAMNGREAVVELLLTKGKANVESIDQYGQTPLSQAAERGHEAVVELLLTKGKANVESIDQYGQTPLSQAAMNGHEAVVELLLTKGKANVESTDQYGRTPLSQAAMNGHEAVVELLLTKGKANVDSKDQDGWTPLSYAAKNENENIVKLLLAMGNVDVDSKDQDGRTPLSWAAGTTNEAIVELLLATGNVDVDSKDQNGETPLSYATYHWHSGVAELLRSFIATKQVAK